MVESGIPRIKTVIVGAGPVGAMAGIYAAGRGHEVEIYELRGGEWGGVSVFPLGLMVDRHCFLCGEGWDCCLLRVIVELFLFMAFGNEVSILSWLSTPDSGLRFWIDLALLAFGLEHCKSRIMLHFLALFQACLDRATITMMLQLPLCYLPSF